MLKSFKFIKLSNLKYLTIGIIIGSLLSVSIAQATNPIKLIVNGADITYKSDVPPQIINGRTLVPARALAESLGASVEWDGVNRVVIVNNRVNNNQNQNNTQTTHEKPYIKNGLEHITINNINYISLSSIINLNYDKGYSFEYDSNSKTAIFVYNSYFGHPIDKNEILLNNIKIKNIQDKSYIEYDYYIENILPLIK